MRAGYLSASAVLVAALSVLAACSDASERARPRESETVSAAAHYPATVAVVNRSASAANVFSGYRCAGVLVAKRVVLTASHCLHGARRGKLDVIIGPKDLCPRSSPVSGERIGVERIVLAPPVHGSDLAALFLRGASRQQPAQIASLRANVPLRAIGWGSSADGTSSCEQQVADLRQVDDSRCARALSAALTSSLQRLNACALPTGSRNTCDGDSGGPLYEATPGQRLVGITSAGTGCELSSIGFYLRLDRFSSWIREQTCSAAGRPDCDR